MPLKQPVDLVFLHHSVGGQWLADEGPLTEHGGTEIHATHPNGGGLRRQLEANNYRVHEASYKSEIAAATDLFDWVPKFRGHMQDILQVRLQDEKLPAGERNRVVMFKSCYPNTKLDPLATAADGGDPAGPQLNQANARATLRALLPEFRKHPDVLFVYVTAPPMAARPRPERAYKYLAKKVLGRPTDAEWADRSAHEARVLNDWVTSSSGWLSGYELKNVVVFDYFDVLTGNGASDYLAYATGGGTDSHPSAAGHRAATAQFIPFLNRAVRQAGVSD